MARNRVENAGEATSEPGARPPAILVIDDDQFARRLMHIHLTQSGYAVTTASSGLEGLATVRDHPPDLILLDVMMPGVDGFAVCRALKQDPDTCAIPVVLLTALNYREDRLRGLDLGADEFLSKPCDPAELLARVRSLVQRKQLHEQLAQSEARYRSLLANIPDVVWRIDSRGRRCFTSSNVVDVCGFTSEEICHGEGGLWLERIHPDDAAGLMAAYAALFARRQPLDVKYRFLRKDGEWIWLHERSITISQAGDDEYADGISSDVTAHKQAEEDRARLASAQAARATAEAMVRARDEFLAVAAHELRTPVTTIWGYASLLRRQRSRLEEPLPQQVSRATEMIDKQSLRLKRLIDRLLDLTRIDTGTLVLDKQLTDVCSLVGGIAEAAQDMTGHPVEVVAPKAIWAQVDPTRLEEVVANLIDNAINYSHAVTSKPVEVKVLRVSSGTVQVAVRDHGHGIPRALRNRIFERYYRTEAGARLGGLGIGLYVSQQIVELHCGRIDIRAAPGGGARFVVTLPTGQEARGRGRGKALHPAETPSSPVEVAS